MKKFTYSAMAIVLFSFAGMASEKNKSELQKTTPATKEEKLSKNIKEASKKVKERDCLAITLDLMPLHFQDINSVWDYIGVFITVYTNCSNNPC